jgi:hypothetical protein
MLSMRRSIRLYEEWLAAQLDGDIVRADLRTKHARMQASPFAFLRATYWRWAEAVLEVCPDLKTAPQVLAVGDIHLENFGTWRDDEGRLIWGVNDFDEAAEMPFALDLVRLATSALLAHGKRGAPASAIAHAVLRGYRLGLDAPCPTVLDRRNRWLHKLLVVSNSRRREFWRDLDEVVANGGKIPRPWCRPPGCAPTMPPTPASAAATSPPGAIAHPIPGMRWRTASSCAACRRTTARSRPTTRPCRR